MKGKNKLPIGRLSLTVLMLFVVVLGGTFAWLTFRSNKAALVLTIGSVGGQNDAQITLTPYQVTGTVTPVVNYKDGTHSDVIINKGNGNSTILYYKINELDTNLRNALQYKIVCGANLDDETSLLEVKTGRFSSYTSNSEYAVIWDESTEINNALALEENQRTQYQNNLLSENCAGSDGSKINVKYRVYTWVDSSEGNQNNLQNSTLDMELNGSIGSVSVTGNPMYGETLTASIIDYTSANTTPSYTYQWYYKDAEHPEGVAISGATGQTYTILEGNAIGEIVYVIVTVDEIGYNKRTYMDETDTVVAKRDIHVTINPATFTYNGQYQKSNSCEVSSAVPGSRYSLLSGHTISCTTTGSIKDVGSVSNNFSAFKVLDGNGNDITHYYNVMGTANSMITITPKPISVVWSPNSTVPELEYTGSSIAPSPSIDTGVLSEAMTFSYSKNIDANNCGSEPQYTSTFTCTGVGNGSNCNNYYISNTTKSYKIVPKAVTVGWNTGQDTFVYDGSGQRPDLSSYAMSVISGQTVNLSTTSNTNVGTDYISTASITSVTNGKTCNYTLTNPTSHKYSIIEYALKLSLVSYSGSVDVYNRSNFTANVETIAACGGTLTAVSKIPANVDVYNVYPTNFTTNGTSIIIYDGVGYTTGTNIEVNFTSSNANCTNATTQTFVAAVNRVNPTITLETGATAVYNGSPIEYNSIKPNGAKIVYDIPTDGNGTAVDFTDELDSLDANGDGFRYTYYTDSTCSTQTTTAIGATAAGGAPKFVGTHYVKAKSIQTSKFNQVESACTAFTITPYQMTLTLSPTSGTIDIGRTGTFTATLKTIPACKIFNFLTLPQEFDLSFNPSSLEKTGTGEGEVSTTVTYSDKVTTDYVHSETIVLQTSIDPVNCSINVPTFTANTRKRTIESLTITSIPDNTYNGSRQAANPAINAVYNGQNIVDEGTVSLEYYTNNTCTTKTSSSDGANTSGGAPTDAGEYYVKATFVANSTYNEKVSVCSGQQTTPVSYKIQPKPLTASFGGCNFTYNGVSQAPTVSVSSGVTGETINLSATGSTAAGNFTSSIDSCSVSGGRADCNNYSISGTKSCSIAKYTPIIFARDENGTTSINQTSITAYHYDKIYYHVDTLGYCPGDVSATSADTSKVEILSGNYRGSLQITNGSIDVKAGTTSSGTKVTLTFTPDDTANCNTVNNTNNFDVVVNKAPCVCSISSFPTLEAPGPSDTSATGTPTGTLSYSCKYTTNDGNNTNDNITVDKTPTVSSNSTYITVGTVGTSSVILTGKLPNSSVGVTVSNPAGTNNLACTTDTENVTVNPSKYTISFDRNGGSACDTLNSVTRTYGNSTETLPTTIPHRYDRAADGSAYEFVGWTLSKMDPLSVGGTVSAGTALWTAGSTYMNGSVETGEGVDGLAANTTLYALWRKVNIATLMDDYGWGYSDTYLRSTLMRSQISSITFVPHNNVPNGMTATNADAGNTGLIKMWYGSANSNGLYDIYIGSKTVYTKLPSNSNNLFGHFQYVTSIKFDYLDACSNSNVSYYLIDTSSVTDMTDMFIGVGVTSLDLSGFDTSNVTSMMGMFYKCENLTTIDLSHFNTSKVTNMSEMFYNCSSLTSLDVTNFDTSKVTDMRALFYNCSSLTSLDVTNFDTSKVTDIGSMFHGCSGLTSLDVSNFNTSQVTNMYGMFADCSSLTSLDVSSFNTSQVTNMQGMFYNCNGLTSLDVSNFNTSNVTNMASMFEGIRWLYELDLSNFNTSNVTNMNRMFYGCENLAYLDISSFDTTYVIDMQGMFYSCASLVGLDLSGFKTTSATNMEYMFYDCLSLEKVILSNNFQFWDDPLPSNRSGYWYRVGVWDRYTPDQLATASISSTPNIAGTYILYGLTVNYYNNNGTPTSVTYYKNNGNCSNSNPSTCLMNTPTVNSNLSSNGWSFMGWSTSSSNYTYMSGSYLDITAYNNADNPVVNLYAVYQRSLRFWGAPVDQYTSTTPAYSMSQNLNAYGCSTNYSSCSTISSVNVDAPASNVDSNTVFIGWQDSAGTIYQVGQSYFISPFVERDIYALFTPSGSQGDTTKTTATFYYRDSLTGNLKSSTATIYYYAKYGTCRVTPPTVGNMTDNSGFTFSGWNDDVNVDDSVEFTGTTISGCSLNYYAVYSRGANFRESNGTNSVKTNQYYNSGEGKYYTKFPASSSFTPPSGFSVAGYRTTDSAASPSYAVSGTYTGSTTQFYVIYSRNVQFYSMNSSSNWVSQNVTQYHVYNNKYALTAPSSVSPSTVNTNFTFAGWVVGSGAKAPDISAGGTYTGSSTTFYAVYSRNATFRSGESTLVIVNNVASYSGGTTVTVPQYYTYNNSYSVTTPTTAANINANGKTYATGGNVTVEFKGWHTIPQGSTNTPSSPGSVVTSSSNEYFAIYRIVSRFYSGFTPGTSVTCTTADKTASRCREVDIYYNTTSYSVVEYNGTNSLPPLNDLTGWTSYGWTNSTTSFSPVSSVLFQSLSDTMIDIYSIYSRYIYFNGSSNTGNYVSDMQYYNEAGNYSTVDMPSTCATVSGFSTCLGWRDDTTAGNKEYDLGALRVNYNGTSANLYTVYSRTITFNGEASGQSGSATQYYNYNGGRSSVTLPSSCETVSGFTCLGWRDDTTAGNKENDLGGSYSGTASNMYTVYSRTITFNGEASGQSGSATQYYNYAGNRSSITLPSTCETSSVLTCLGWRDDTTAGNKEYDLGGSYSGASASMYTVYSDTITFHGEGSGQSGSATQYYNFAGGRSSVTLPSTCESVSGYTCLGWRDDTTAGAKENDLGGSYSGTSDNLYTVYSRTITFNGEASGQSGSATQYYNYNGGRSSVTLPSSCESVSGFTCLGWRDDTTAGAKENDLGGSYSGTASNMYTVYSRTITFNGEGSGEAGTATQYYNYAGNRSSITLPTTWIHLQGWQCLGWRDDTTAGVPEYLDYVTSPSDTTIANYTGGDQMYTVYGRAITFDGEASGEAGTALQYLNYAGNHSSVTLPSSCEAKSGWQCLGWRDDTTAETKEYDLGGSYNYNGSSSIFYAVYSRTITLYGGTTNPTQYYNYAGNRSSVTLPSTCETKTGWTCSGWIIYGQQTYGLGASYSGSATALYASYNRTITFVSSSGNTTVNQVFYHTYGNQGATSPGSNKCPTVSGWTCSGWRSSDTAGAPDLAFATNYTGDASTFYLIYKRSAYFYSDDEGATITNVDQYRTESNKYSVATPSTAYALSVDNEVYSDGSDVVVDFVGWTTSNYNSPPDSYVVAGNNATSSNQSYYAYYKIKARMYSGESELTCTADDIASLSCQIVDVSYVSGVPDLYIQFPANVKTVSNYTAIGWRVDTVASNEHVSLGENKNFEVSDSLTMAGDLSGYEYYQWYAVYSTSGGGAATFCSGSGCSTSETYGGGTAYYNASGTTSGSGSSSVTFPTPAQVTNYSALGWRKDTSAATKTYSIGSSYTVSAGETYYAVYSRTATFYYGKAKASSTTATQYYNSYGTQSVTTPSTIGSLNSNWTAVGWVGSSTSYTESSATSAGSKSTMTSQTFYALYKRTLSFIHGKSTAQQTATLTQHYNSYGNTESITTPTPSSLTNWTTSGWRRDTSKGARQYSSGQSVAYGITYSNTLYAIYTRNITVNFEGGGGTLISGQTATSTQTAYYNPINNRAYIASFTLKGVIYTSQCETYSTWDSAAKSSSSQVLTAGGSHVLYPTYSETSSYSVSLTPEWTSEGIVPTLSQLLVQVDNSVDYTGEWTNQNIFISTLWNDNNCQIDPNVTITSETGSTSVITGGSCNTNNNNCNMSVQVSSGNVYIDTIYIKVGNVLGNYSEVVSIPVNIDKQAPYCKVLLANQYAYVEAEDNYSGVKCYAIQPNTNFTVNGACPTNGNTRYPCTSTTPYYAIVEDNAGNKSVCNRAFPNCNATISG